MAPVYTICLLNYDINVFTPTKFRTDVALMDMKENKVFSDRIRLIYLMLPLFKKNTEEECETDFERWIFILKNMSTFERMPFAARNAVFKKLAEIADISALSKEDKEKYDESLKVMLDYYATMDGATIIGKREGREQGLKEGMEQGLKEGIEQGIKQGIQQGIQQGMQQGIQQGIQQDKLDIAKLMLKEGEPIGKIALYTGLSQESIKDLMQ